MSSKVSILTRDFSNNCLGRSYVLAKALQHGFQVELVGPLLGDGIWSPLSRIGDEFEVKTIHAQYGDPALPVVRSVSAAIAGDIIYASKPSVFSYGAALHHKNISGVPVVLDIDDWELGLQSDRLMKMKSVRKAKEMVRSFIKPFDPESIVGVFGLEKLGKYADAITVSNRFLQARFGGDIVWHGRDTELLRPLATGDKSALRECQGIANNSFVVMFLGTPRPHKGLEVLVDAMTMVNGSNALLWLVGVGRDGYGEALRDLASKRLKNQVKFTSGIPFEDIPRYIGAADVITVPQLSSNGSVGQMPAKIFDALALGKPVIVTDVSDLAEVVSGAGIVVPPGDPHGLAVAINKMQESQNLRDSYGSRGRLNAERLYSIAAMSAVVAPIFRGLLGGSEARPATS